MKKMVWSKLPKKDKKHLRESKIIYKWQFEKQVKFLKSEMKKHPQNRFVCYDCIRIAKKIGMW